MSEPGMAGDDELGQLFGLIQGGNLKFSTIAGGGSIYPSDNQTMAA